MVIEVWQDTQLNSSAFSHCSVWRFAIGKGVLRVHDHNSALKKQKAVSAYL